MLIKRFYDDKLAQASWMVGCQATGDALVIDANRDVEQYITVAEREGLRISHVTETHIHADFVSGSRELAGRTGATLLLSDEGGDGWRYVFANESKAVLLRDGDRFTVGNLAFDVLHTPGHTPEHLSFMVTDTPATASPMGIFTGDFIFAGDVGRPDLLERAAGVSGTMEASARRLFASLKRFRALPDYLQLWPGHGAGSACGKALGAIPSTTLGYEKLANWGFAIEDEDEFVERVLAGQPEPPAYFADMKRINRDGPRSLHGLHRPERLPETRLAGILAAGGIVIDTRPAPEYASRHIAGTINIPLDRSFTTWAGWLVPYDVDFHLLVDDEYAHLVEEALRDLAMIGLDRVAGYFGRDSIDAWESEGRVLSAVPQLRARELVVAMREGRVSVVDVRGASEWQGGHIPGVPNVPLGYLRTRIRELPRDLPVVVQCQGGGRSAIAASVLRAHGVHDVLNLVGGINEWERAGLPVERAEDAPSLVRRVA